MTDENHISYSFKSGRFKIPFLLLLLRPHVLGKEKAVQEFLLGETILQESGAARYLHIAQTKT